MRKSISKIVRAGLVALALTFGCTTTIEPPPPSKSDYSSSADDTSSSVYTSSSSSSSSSSSLSVGKVSCSFGGQCLSIPFEDCSSIGGQIVQNCPAASSSSGGVSPPLASSSSSSRVSQPLSSSSSVPISSSSIVPSSSSQNEQTQCKTNFYSNLNITDNSMCVLSQCSSDTSFAGNKERCGADLVAGGYAIDFYMIRRGTSDTTYLSGTKNDCSGNAETFACFAGIQVNKAVYRCGGRSQCNGNSEATSKVHVVGNFFVYARLMKNGVQVPDSKSLMIDRFKSETYTRLVWGSLESEDGKVKTVLKDADGNAATQNQTIIAGKRTPVYIANGVWANNNYAAFIYDNDPDYVTGIPYALTVSGGTGLTIEPKTSGALPASGIDTLWVKGNSNGTYYLNVANESESAPSMKLTIITP